MQVTTDDLFVLLLSVRFVSLFTELSVACIHIQQFLYEYYFFLFFFIQFFIFIIFDYFFIMGNKSHAGTAWM